MKLEIVYSVPHEIYYIGEAITNPVEKFFVRESVVSTRWLILNFMWNNELLDLKKYKIKTDNDEKSAFCFQTKEDAQFFIDDYLIPLLMIVKLIE